MLKVSFPKTFVQGDRRPCTINGVAKECIYANQGCLVFVPPGTPYDDDTLNVCEDLNILDARIITDIMVYPDRNTFICSDKGDTSAKSQVVVK
jgi:hypothetical protein